MNTKPFLRACALLMCACLCVAASAEAAAGKSAGHAKKSAAHAKAAPALPSLVWRGDHNTDRAFMKDFAQDYQASKQGRLVLQPFSTISGIDAVNDGSADLAGSSRPAMLDRPQERSMIFHPVAWDALVMITSPKNPVGNLTLKQIHDIYLGHLTNWSELGGPPGEIDLYAVAGPLDGNEYSLRDLIFHHGDQAVAVPRLYVNVEKLEEGIAIDPHGLGLSTLSAAHANPALKMLTVEGIEATPASVADGSYPLYSTLFLAARDDSPNHEAIEKFVHYTTSEPALAILRKHDLVPYGDAPNLVTHQAERSAYIDAHVYGAASAVSATATASTTPVSAPVATADALRRDAPTSQRAFEAKARVEQLKAEKAARKAEGEASHP